MSNFERLLEPGSTERPTCLCAAEMALTVTERNTDTPDIELRTYKCPACGHQLKLSVWTEGP